MSLRCGVLATAQHTAIARIGASAAAHWAWFGDDVLVWSSSADADARLQDLGVSSRAAGGLALVTQVGRSFQDDLPDVRVILDHGRHLVVDSTTLPEAMPGSSTCWRVGALPTDAVVVDRVHAAPARSDPAVVAVVDAVSPAAYQADLTWLVDLGTRHSLSPGFASAVDWASARLTGLGFSTTRQTVTVGSGHSANVVADRPGAGVGQRRLILVTAHLDSVNSAGGPSAPAPGADDNASGSAGVLEIARVLAIRQWQHDLRLILFGGEEQGLHGSRQYVAALPAGERARIRAVLNMDMIATRNTPEPAVLIEGSTLSSDLINDLAVAAAGHTGLRVETSLHPFASDHVPFLDAGVPAVLTIEGADSANGHVHSAGDVMAHIDLTLMQQILRMNLAACAHWLEPVPVGPRASGPVVAWGPERLDVMVRGSDGAIYHKAWDGRTWQPSVTDYEALGTPGIDT